MVIYGGMGREDRLKVQDETGAFPVVCDRLCQAPNPPAMVRSGGHAWIPIDVPLQTEAAAIVESIVQDAERILAIARGQTLDAHI